MPAECSQGTTNENCSSEQSFCTINASQAVKDIMPAGQYTLSSLTAGTTVVTDTIWNVIYSTLKKIYDYPGSGAEHHGTRNPTDNVKNSSVSDDQLVTLGLYNDILSSIDINTLTENSPVITKSLMDTLQDKIKNYQFYSNRCVSCNTACNTTCEAADQCTCSNQNDQCGGGGCGCSQYGCLADFTGGCSGDQCGTTVLGNGCTY